MQIDFSDKLWTKAYIFATPDKIIGRDQIVQTLFSLADELNVRAGMKWLWEADDTSIIDQVNFATGNGAVTDTIPSRDDANKNGVTLSVWGGNGDNIDGSNHDDLIYGGEGSDVLFGGAGEDIVAGGKGADELHGGDERSVLLGGPGDDMLIGGDADDMLFGNSDDDVLLGNGGNDELVGGYGNDVLVGGSGEDTVNYGQQVLFTSGRSALLINITEHDSPPTSTTRRGRESDDIHGIEIIKATAGMDIVNIRLASDSSLTRIQTLGGSDRITIDGVLQPQTILIELGDGDDVAGGSCQNCEIYGETGADEFQLGHNYLAADVDREDRITFLDQTLTGGIRNKNSELIWANGRFSERYAVNPSGELGIVDPNGRITFVAGFDRSIDGGQTAGLRVYELALEAYKLLETPNGWQLFETMEDLLGHAMKALTGISYFNTVDPLVIDVDGDGIELLPRSSVSPHFDYVGDGFARPTGWVRPDDALLVHDKNSNGIVDGIDELFGDHETSGFSALTQLDDNGDQTISANDAAFESLYLWFDRDGDAAFDDGELQSLAEAGIESLGLNATELSNETVAGNRITATSHVTLTNGDIRDLADVAFATNPRQTMWLGDSTISETAALLPEVKGLGTLTDLRIAMTQSAGLQEIVETALADGSLATSDLQALRTAITPITISWRDAVTVSEGTPGTIDRTDVPVLFNTTLSGGSEVLDFAIPQSDENGNYWVRASGRPVKDVDGNDVDFPSLAQLLAQSEDEGAWSLFRGSDIQFAERRLGLELPVGNAANQTGGAAIDAVQTTLEFMWQELDEVAVRLAVQGSLSTFFPFISYDVIHDSFYATIERQLAPTFEAIFAAAPGSPEGDSAYIASWKTFLDVFLQDFDRGEDYLIVSYSYLFQNLVAAYENVGLSTGITEAASALDIPSELVHTGSGSIVGTDDADIFYMHADHQVAMGGAGPDSYVFGRRFGENVIQDVEPAPFDSSYDLIRFAFLTSDQATFTRNGDDLWINANDNTDSIHVIGQFSGQRPGLFGGTVDDDLGVNEIIFANGEVWGELEIAQAVSRNTGGDDVIEGTRVIDFLDGGPGNDILRGHDSGDVYRFGFGDGQDKVEDLQDYILLAGPDMLQFKPGVSVDFTARVKAP
ncbi:MAG: hypothetical protein KDB27_22500, partial [Planctomycetales bacterium]|nr:hypothetical protein [Planctomycetales bacterium]